MPTKNDLIMFGIVAVAAASGVFLYGWAVTQFAGRSQALADSAAAFNSPATY